MRTFLLILTVIVYVSCNSHTEKKASENSVKPVEMEPVAENCNVALKFINDYVAFIVSPKKATSGSAWIEQYPFLTANFKSAYKKLVDSARKADPEMGLDFDPILDAQDFPDKGFVHTNCDSNMGYVSLRGKDWKDFILVLKVVEQNNQWFVDGAGVINIPIDKRAKR